MKIRIEFFNKPKWFAAITAFIFGIAMHLFGLVNSLHNYDDIAVLPEGYGTGLASGRWFLTVLGDFIQKHWGNYNLPLFNGVVFIIFIAASATFFVSTFNLKSRKSSALIGLLFVSFPTATATLFFKYTATYYGLSIFLAVLAVWILEKYKYGFLFSGLFTAISLGIYQAYIPITVGMFVLLLIKRVLEEDVKFFPTIRRGIYYCCNIIAGLLLYYLFLHLCLSYYDMELGSYQGVNEMGKLSISELPLLIWSAFKSFCMLPINDYCNLAQTSLLKILYLVLGVLTIFLIGFILIAKKKKISIVLLTLLLCAVFPIAVNLIVIMCYDSYIYTLMVYAFVLVLCVPLIVFETLPSITGVLSKVKNILWKTIVIALSIVILNYSYLANVNYSALYFSNRQIENYLNSMVVQVRMTEGFDTDKKWAIIGNLEDPLLNNWWQYVPTYAGNANVYRLFNSYSRSAWIKNYFGYSIPWADEQTISDIQETEEFNNMSVWPNEGSIKVIGDTVVIKLQDQSTDPE